MRILSKSLPNLNILRLHGRLVNLANKSMRKLNLIIQCTHLRAIHGFFPALAYRGRFVSAPKISLCKVSPICARSSRSERKAQDWIFNVQITIRSVATIYHCYSLERSLVPGSARYEQPIQCVKNLLPT